MRTVVRASWCGAAIAALLLGSVTGMAGADQPEQNMTVNVALGKTPTTNATEPVKADSDEVLVAPGAASDGSTAYQGDETGVTEIAAGTENSALDNNGWSTWRDVYVQYDVGEPRAIEQVRLYHNQYATSVSTFKNVKVEIATDKEFSNIVFSSGSADFKETADTKGQPQDFKLPHPVTGQFVRIWQRGHFIESTATSWKGMSNKVRFREIQIMATAKESEIPNLQPRNIAAGKLPYVYGLAPTNIQAITDGKWDTNYAVHNTPSPDWLQFEFKNTYTIKQIKLGLEPGTYNSVKVSIASSPVSSISKTTGLPSSAGTEVYNQTNVAVSDSLTIAAPENTPAGSVVRFVVDKDTASPVKYSEVEIWATGATYDESVPEYQAPKSAYDQLVWSDEFNGTAIDESKWNIIEGMANHGAIYNRGAVSIKKGLEQDASNGYLAINSKNMGSTDALKQAVGWDPYPGEENLGSHVTWSSGRLESKNKYSFEFGRMAVRAKANDSQGIWPAIWMLSQDEKGHDEIDVLEYIGQEPWTAYMTNHYGVWGYNKGSNGGTATTFEAWSQQFHVYEVEWTPTKITWFIDGKEKYSTTQQCSSGPCDAMHHLPMFPILETQVGAGWVGDVDYQKRWTKQDSDFLVDWVRVYQQDGQDRVRFDDLESTRPADCEYRIAPVEQTNAVAMTTGFTSAQDKNNFFYGGQPRYEANRLISADKPAELIYHIDGVHEVRLTAYYQTVSDMVRVNSNNNTKEGTSIRKKLVGEANLDFTVLTSTDGDTWTPQAVQIHDNFTDAPPAYARNNIAATGLPEGTKFVKIVFPDVSNVKYLMGSGVQKAVEPGDVQLAKVAFLQDSSVPTVSPAPTETPNPTETPKPTGTPHPTGSASVEPTEDPINTPKPTDPAGVQPTETSTAQPSGASSMGPTHVATSQPSGQMPDQASQNVKQGSDQPKTPGARSGLAVTGSSAGGLVAVGAVLTLAGALLVMRRKSQRV